MRTPGHCARLAALTRGGSYMSPDDLMFWARMRPDDMMLWAFIGIVLAVFFILRA